MRVNDPLGAFLTDGAVDVPHAAAGPLAGLSVAAKDIYDIAGYPTGFGCPDWRRTHPVPTRTASSVQALLDAGAKLIGKTHTDEMAFSLNGENAHYGTPINPACPDRVPGGSSNGSASAVAGGLVDTALGTDTGGSVRIPASFCGIWGLRTTHGAIATDGVLPLAPSFDVVGWFARDAVTLARVGDVLLPPGPGDLPGRMLRVDQAFALADAAAVDSLAAALARAERALGAAAPVDLCGLAGTDSLSEWLPHFQALQWREIWDTHRDWMAREQPTFSSMVGERMRMVGTVADARVDAARDFREQVAHALDALLGADTVLVLPTAPNPALLKGLPPDQVTEIRGRMLSILCIAGLARLPQISMPLAAAEGCPVGLSLIGPRGSDHRLLAAARAIAETP